MKFLLLFLTSWSLTSYVVFSFHNSNHKQHIDFRNHQLKLKSSYLDELNAFKAEKKVLVGLTTVRIPYTIDFLCSYELLKYK